MNKLILTSMVWAALVAAPLAQEIVSSRTSIPGIHESDYFALNDNRALISGVYENELVAVETLKIHLNNDEILDTIYLATFAHEGQEVYQQLEIWVSIGGTEYAVYMNSDYGVPYIRMFGVDDVPYIVDSSNNTIWLNWKGLAEPWVKDEYIKPDPTWLELLNGG